MGPFLLGISQDAPGVGREANFPNQNILIPQRGPNHLELPPLEPRLFLLLPTQSFPRNSRISTVFPELWGHRVVQIHGGVSSFTVKEPLRVSCCSGGWRGPWNLLPLFNSMFSGLRLRRERPELLGWHPGICVSPCPLSHWDTPWNWGWGSGVPAFPGSRIFPAGSLPAAPLTTGTD